MCAAGAPAAMYLQYADPSSAFNLNYSVTVLAMSLIGGTAHWAGPVIGAILLGTTQQLLTVTISSEVNVLVLGVMLVFFVVGIGVRVEHVSPSRGAFDRGDDVGAPAFREVGYRLEKACRLHLNR